MTSPEKELPAENHKDGLRQASGAYAIQQEPVRQSGRPSGGA
jgi:hypothetical protein